MDFLFFGCWGVYCQDSTFQKKKEKKGKIKIKKVEYLGNSAFNILNNYSKENDITYNAVLIGGDNVYGTPDEQHIHDIDKQLVNGFENCIAKLPSEIFLVGIGNHDIVNCEILNKEKKYSGFNSKKWIADNYFSHTIDSVDFFFIDTNIYQNEHCDSKITLEEIQQLKTNQFNWLKNSLLQSKNKFKVIIGHIPPISCSHKDDSNIRIEKDLLNDMTSLSNLFNLYLCADEHNQQFIKFENEDKILNIVVSGSGGAPLDDLFCPTEIPGVEVLYSSKTVGGVHLQFKKNSIIVKFVNNTGISSFTL